MGKLDWRNRACAAVLLCVATAIGLSAQTFTRLHRFDGTDGSSPYAGLVQATGGNLYGTTETGGANNYYGTVFKITPSGTLTTLYSFCSQSGCADGANPYAGVVQDTNGNFYGTTGGGGVTSGGGTVFKITPSGTLTTLYSFCSESGCPDGRNPGTLVQATNGNFYGTTGYGGANNAGTVFKITRSGTLTTLYSFCSQSGCKDGQYPSPLVQATDGNFYGTTSEGGANKPDCGNIGCGTVFKITPSGTLTSLHSFDGRDGSLPEAGLVQAAGGNFYGTTLYGGVNDGGTVFKISPSGTLTSLYSFCSQSGCTDGLHPEAALVQATDGNFYGTTPEGGANPTGCKGFGCGTVFKITPSGTLTTLYRLTGPGGVYPAAGLVQDTNGNFYGTTLWGGGLCGGFCGTVFSLSVGLGPFVKTQPASARVGGFVQILGTNLTGATSVSFNGTPAVFRVVLNSWIKTTVPEGATTGTVEVVTPSGTLSSNVPFRVRP
jgi:uncharacterized repeat protein (TIGR03803 family)